MGLRTSLYSSHLECHAVIVDFGGWDMPLHYGSQIAEHHAVRRSAGMFDVSHMCVVDIGGIRAREYLTRLLANDVGKLTLPGKALYSCMLLPDGGIIDDLIVYFLTESWFRLVVNAGTRDKDLAWLRQQADECGVQISQRADLAIIAVQGPEARSRTLAVLPPWSHEDTLCIRPFFGRQIDSWFVARTGYTGEDGFELMMPADVAATTWKGLADAGVVPAGLGARDTLRLEAGMNLYGNDMDERRHPLESGLGWTVCFDSADRDFIGREALERVRIAGCEELVGLILEDRGVLRSHQPVVTTDGGRGEVTSGTFSPTMNRSIGLARLPRDAGARVQVDMRGRLHPARVIEPPFVRHGKILVNL